MFKNLEQIQQFLQIMRFFYRLFMVQKHSFELFFCRLLAMITKQIGEFFPSKAALPWPVQDRDDLYRTMPVDH